MSTKKVLTGLNSTEYEHPLDKEYLDILENILTLL